MGGIGIYDVAWYVAYAILASVALGAVWLYLWLQRPHLEAKAPSGAITAAFKGDLREHAFLRIFQEYGKTCEMEGFVVTCDPELVKTLMTTPEHTKLRSRFYTASSYLLYGMSGLLDIDGEKWQAHKKTLYPLFHFGNVDKFVSDFHSVMARHADSWSRGVEAKDGVLAEDAATAASDKSKLKDLVAGCRAAGLEGLLSFALRMDASTERGRELSRQLTLYGAHLKNMGDGTDGMLSLPLGVYRVIDCTNRIRSLVKAEMVGRFGAETKAEASTAAVKDAETTAEGESSPTSRLPVDGLRAMWLAGFGANETAAEVNHVNGAHKAAGFSLACLLWRLSSPANRPWLGRLRGEWLALLGPPGADEPPLARSASPTRRTIKTLELSLAVIQEALRLHVVSLCTGRRTGLPLELDGVTLPPGTEVGVCLQAMHTHPDHFSKPLEFRPERWLPPSHPLYEPELTVNKAAFLPFLSGPRKCAGQQLAEMELLVGMHAVLDRYTLDSDVKTLKLRPDLYASLEQPISFSCTPRTD